MRLLMLRAFVSGLALLTFGCGAAPPPPARAPHSDTNPPPAVETPVAPPAATDAAWGAPPASCGEPVAKAPAKLQTCTRETSERLLANALRKDGAARDAELWALESCSLFPTGVVRALRAERAAPECRDALVGDYTPPASTRSDVKDALLGLTIAARLRRLVRSPPVLPPPHDRARVDAFVKGTLAKWIQGQAAAVFELSNQGAALSGYGKGIVAVEAGMADMRFVEVARSAPLPDDIRGDDELTEAYYATLDQALEPRKARGRDAALVGLRLLSDVGVLHDERVARARKMLSTLYAGRRIDALDALLLPGPVEPEGAQPWDEALAEVLPTFYVSLLVPDADVTRPGMMRSLLHRGLPAFVRLRLDAAKPEADTRRLYARHLFEMGRTYWRAEDFARAGQVAAGLSGAEPELLVALADVLKHGPKDAAAMMLQGPHLPAELTQVAPLDGLGKRSPSLAGFAAFAAGVLLETAPPANAPRKYWQDVAARYASAEKKLPPELRGRATERRTAAEATAQAVK